MKVITSEQVDAMMEKVRSIPGAGKIVFTPEFNEKYAELQERPKPYMLLSVEPNLLRVTGRTFPLKHFLKQEDFTNRGGPEHLFTSLTQDETEITAKHVDLQELCDFWGFVLPCAWPN